MRTTQIVKSDLERVKQLVADATKRKDDLNEELKQVRGEIAVNAQRVADLETELSQSEGFEQQMKMQTVNYAEKFNAERNKNVINPFK